MFCGECGTQLSDNAKFCRSCGHAVSNPVSAATAPAPVVNNTASSAPAAAVALAPARDAEMTFLQKDGVRVTNTRFIVPGQTFAMAGVTSVRSVKIEPNRKWAFVSIVFGGLFLMIPSSRVLGLLLLIAGTVWAVVVKPTFAVALNSASGEHHAITSSSTEYINSIVTALNEAIVYRR